MRRCNVTLQRRVFPKDLIARWMLRATELFLLLMPLKMSPQSCTVDKLLVAAWPCTRKITLVGMRTLDVSCQVIVAEKALVTAFVLTLERPLSRMGPDMLCQSTWSIETLPTVLVRTSIDARSPVLRLGSRRERCGGRSCIIIDTGC